MRYQEVQNGIAVWADRGSGRGYSENDITVKVAPGPSLKQR